MKQPVLRNMFNKTSKNICTSTVVASPDSLSPTLISLTMKIQQNKAEDSDDPEPADEGYIQMEYTSN
jgi:hypothetical protein